MNVINVLNHLVRLELMMQALYVYFEKLFGYESEAAGLFHELSIEEKSHADLLRYQLRVVKNNLNVFSDIPYDLDSLLDLMKQIDGILSSEQPPTLRDAISFCIKAEKSACELHYNTAIAESNKEMGEVIKNLGAYDEAHNNRLMTFALTLGIRE